MWIPLFKSSNLNLWPVLHDFHASNFISPVLPVAFYFGKPDNKTFNSKFVEEFRDICQQGFKCSGILVKLMKTTFTCDTPARTQILQTKGHGGCDSCTYCRCKGEYVNRRVIFDYFDTPRSDTEYRNFQESNQTFLTPLIKISNIKSDYPPDPMHFICLGIARKLFRYFFFNVKGMRLDCRLTRSKVNDACAIVKKHCLSFPVEFHRKPDRLMFLTILKPLNLDRIFFTFRLLFLRICLKRVTMSILCYYISLYLYFLQNAFFIFARMPMFV